MVVLLDNKKIINKYSKIIPPWGPIGYIIYKRTYARKIGSRTEEWHEALFRCVNGLQQIGCNFTECELYEFYDHLFFMRGMLSGRAMWQLGSKLASEMIGDSLCNCFAKDTKILTKSGWKKIKDCVDIDNMLLSSNGKWIKSKVKCFGKQKLYVVKYKIDSKLYIINATADHLWYIGHNKDIKKTISLKKDDLLPIIYSDICLEKTEYAKVISIEETNIVEDVYCAIVPETHSFVIDGNVLTHNCWSVSIDNTDAFQFIFEELMLGGGVGYNITFEKVYSLPKIKKVDFIRRKDSNDADFIVPDSRQGWVSLLRRIIKSFFYSQRSFTYSLHCIRSKGAPIKGFGGKSSGPDILEYMINNIFKIMTNQIGKKLTPIDVLDICNILGYVVVSGNLRRCLIKTCEILTDNGLKKISEINIGDRVLTLDGYKNVTNKFNNGKQNLLSINLNNKRSFKCTNNHKIAILDDLYGKYIWKKAIDLKVGDTLLLNAIECDGKYNNPAEAYFYGILNGNGYVKKRKHKSGYIIYECNIVYPETFAGKKSYYKNKKYLESIGVKGNKYKYHNNYFNIICYNKDFICKISEYKVPNKEPKIPKFIFSSNIITRCSYIAGICDADGTSNEYIICSSKYKNFLKNIQFICISLGIDTYINTRKPKILKSMNKIYDPENRLIIRGWWSRRRACKLINPYMSKQFIVKDKYNFDAYIDKKFILDAYNNDKIKKTEFNTFSSISKKTNEYRNATHARLIKKFPEFWKKVIPVQVESIDIDCDFDDTFDIEVEDSHCFFADGLLVHNSASIALGNIEDKDFLNAKRWDLGKIPKWRAMSNNTIISNKSPRKDSIFWDGYYGNGEPYGLFNLDLSRKKGRIIDVDNYDESIDAINPCQPKFATVLTKDGIKTFEDIDIGSVIWSSNGWTKVVNKSSSGVKDVYKYRTNANLFIGTKNHSIFSNGNEINIKDANSIDILSGEYNNNLEIDVLDVVDGLVIGDGCVHKSSNNLVYIIIGENDHDYFHSEIKYFIIKHIQCLSDKAYIVNTTIKHFELPKTYERVIPDRFLYGNSNKVIGFLRGLYSENGSVVAFQRVTLKSSSSLFAEQVQIMLSSIGITSYITKNKLSKVKFKNSEYLIRNNYDINITYDVDKFYNLIGFLQKYKNEKLIYVIKKKNLYKIKNKNMSSDINKIDFLGTMPVYNITVDNKDHTYWTGGCNVSNCGEVTLSGKCESCNLSTLVLPNLKNIKQAYRVSEFLLRFNKTITTLNWLYPKTTEIIRKNRRIGVSITGILQKHIFSIKELDKLYKHLKLVDAKISKDMNIPESIRITTIAPDGTKSLLSGVTSGCHPWYSQYIIRRVRMDSEEPLVEICKNNGYKIEPLLNLDGSYDHRTMVIEFPVQAPIGSKISKDLSAIQHLEVVKDLQMYWSDNSISATIYYKDEELKEIQKWLRKNYANNIKSISFLRHNDHGFKQAPLEEISKKEFEKKSSVIKQIYSVDVDTYVDILDNNCEGGMCPIR